MHLWIIKKEKSLWFSFLAFCTICTFISSLYPKKLQRNYQNWFPLFERCADGLSSCPSWRRHDTFVKWLRVHSWQHNQTRCTQLRRRFLFSACESLLAALWKEPLAWFERARSEYKRQMNCLCFPICLFKYWNTKSFSEGDNVAGFAEQMRFSPRKTNSFKSLGASGCVFALQVQSLLG